MSEVEVSKRLSAWAKLRQDINNSETPLQDVWEYWHGVRFTAYNHKINPRDPETWTTPWEIIADNIYDDFTIALMMAWTLKLTPKFENVKITIQVLVDNSMLRQYNVVCVEDYGVLNYDDNGPVTAEKWPDTFSVDYVVEVDRPS